MVTVFKYCPALSFHHTETPKVQIGEYTWNSVINYLKFHVSYLPLRVWCSAWPLAGDEVLLFD